MSKTMSAGLKFHEATRAEYELRRRHDLKQRMLPQARDGEGIVYGEDDVRAAELGLLAELPTLGEVLAAWAQRVADDKCEDYAVDFRRVAMAGNGELMPMGCNVDEKRGTVAMRGGDTLPMTYRTFGHLLRGWCPVRRNVAANMIDLPTDATGPGHTGRTFRISVLPGLWDSPRAAAYNATLDARKRRDETVGRIDESNEPTEVIFRTRLLHRSGDDGRVLDSKRVAIGVVTPTHCLQGGDDDKLIAAIALAFAGHASTAVATAYRGVEESELRAVFPALEVQVGGRERWAGYITARNSESGSKSWSVSAGLYRMRDGASVACEAVIRTGRHVGDRVSERMVEVAAGAYELLKMLLEKATGLSSVRWEKSTVAFLSALRASLNGTPAHDGDVCCGIAWALGAAVGDGPITVGHLMEVLGDVAAAMPRRVDARPIEVMLGRTLLNGWKDFKAAGTEVNEDGSQDEVVS